jgi:cytochrome c oxidase cbb3-type subunit 3
VSTQLSVFVATLVVLNIAGALWLLWALQKRKAGDSNETTHVWDGDLTEFNSPLPRWWLTLFYLSIAFGTAYLVAYPGFGAFRGVLGWTQEKELAAQIRAIDRAQSARLAQFDPLDNVALQRDPAAMAMARGIFQNSCAACHGSDARGAKGFPNLTDADWLYGGDTETLATTISSGRIGVMPAWGDALGHNGVEEVIAYVLSVSGNKADERAASAGKEKFAQFCAACHGLDAKGNTSLGAPNLTDDIWLYGKTPQVLRETISHGRNAEMPAHQDILGARRIRLLTAYIQSLRPPRVQHGDHGVAR